MDNKNKRPLIIGVIAVVIIVVVALIAFLVTGNNDDTSDIEEDTPVESPDQPSLEDKKPEEITTTRPTKDPANDEAKENIAEVTKLLGSFGPKDMEPKTTDEFFDIEKTGKTRKKAYEDALATMNISPDSPRRVGDPKSELRPAQPAPIVSQKIQGLRINESEERNTFDVSFIADITTISQDGNDSEWDGRYTTISFRENIAGTATVDDDGLVMDISVDPEDILAWQPYPDLSYAAIRDNPGAKKERHKLKDMDSLTTTRNV